jgi:hypothetical protein
VAAVTAVLATVGGSGPGPASATSGPASGGTSLQIFYRSPVLVRAGEPVRIPVDVACVRRGAPCASSVRLTLGGPEPLSRLAPAAPGLEFDLTAPASRVRSGGRLDFTLSAGTGTTGPTMLPAGGRDALHVYVARQMTSVTMPAIPFGAYRAGRQVLFLPWGSGQSNAGLSAGEEAETLGPSSFAVGPDGTIEIVDAFHQRILGFRGGRLITALRLPMSPQTDIAVGAEGESFVASDFAIGQRATRFTVLDAGGDLEAFRTVPGGILAQVGTDGASGFARVLPLDAWVPFPVTADAAMSPSGTGMPLPSGRELLRSVVGDSVRLGIADGTSVSNAIELRSAMPLGDLAFAAPDGAGGYVAVIRVLESGGDQYEVAHVAKDATVDAFAVPSHQFAGTMPQSQFRLGPRGALYQMRTSPDGVRIVRYAMGGDR